MATFSMISRNKKKVNIMSVVSWGIKWRRLGIVRYKCEILISVGGKLLSECIRITGSVKYSFKMCSHDFKGRSGNTGYSLQ